MSNPHNLEVGQELFVVHSRGGLTNGLHKVSKIGRKWASLEGWYGSKVSLESLVVDGGNYMSPASCYISEEVYNKKQEKMLAWLEIRRKVASMQSHQLTIESIQEIARILDI